MSNFKFINLKGKAKGKSITIEWGVETDIPENELSQWVYIFLGDDPVGDPIELSQKARSYTMEEMKADTEYCIYLQAYQEPGHDPLPEEYCIVKTEAIDTCPPEVSSKVLEVSDLTSDSFKISWKKAKDAVTKAGSILYTVYLKEADEPETAWAPVVSKKNIGTATIKDLKTGAQYVFYVEAADEAGNVLRYDSGVASTEDKVAPVIKNANLRVVDVTNDRITIEWDKATDNVTKDSDIRYTISWCNADDPKPSWRSAIIKGANAYTITDLKPGCKYAIRADARDEGKNITCYSDLSVQTKDDVAPEIEDKMIKADCRDHEIIISWTPAKDNVTPMENIVYMVSRTEAGKWLSAIEVKGKNRYCFDGLKSGEQYSFRVVAKDEAGNVQKYAECLAETRDTEVPQIGSGKVKMATRSDNELTIEWDPATDNVTAAPNITYFVSRIEGEAWEPSIKLTGKTFYHFTGLKSGTEYRFRVIAADEAGNKSAYPILTAKTKDSIAPVSSDRSVKATATANRVTIEWARANDNVTDVNKILYVISQKMASGHWQELKRAPGINSYEITGLTAGKEYFFQVEAFDEASNGLTYNTVSVTTKDNVAPSISNNTIKATATENSVTLEWTLANDNVTNADKIRYVIYQMISGNWKEVKRGLGIKTCTITGLSAGKQYSFKVEAFDDAGNSQAYTSVNVKTQDKVAPTINNKVISTSNITTNSVYLSWAAASDNVSVHSGINYRIYIIAQGASAWSIAYESKGITSYKLTGLSPSTKYSILVRAFDESGNYSDYSTTSVTTLITTVLSRPGQYYCDGVYPGNTGAVAKYLYDSIASPFSRQYFELSFEFYGLFPTSETSTPFGKNILMFGSVGRVFGLSVKDGYIYVSTNNLTNLFNTYIRYTQQAWQSINLVHNSGRLTINGKVIAIGYVKNEGDNILTSCDYSRGSSFKGYFRNIVLKSKSTASVPVILSKPNTFTCNGVYQNGAVALKEDLGTKLNRNYFEISFDFCPASCDKQSSSLNNIITLDSSYRALGLIMKEGAVVVTKNNGSNSYTTGVKFTLNQWQHIDLILNNGYLTINGKVIYLGSIQWSSSNNLLSSLNYSNGHAFKGQFKNLVVKSK